MDIIGKAFNPAGGAAKAVCEKVDGCIRGQIIKGDGPDSPSLVFNRELHLNDDGIWGKCIHKNSGRQLGTWPESPYTLKADYIALSAEFMTVRPEIYVARDLLCKDHFNLYLGKDAVLLSSAPYERERDWEKLNEAILGAFRAMCGDNPEEHWEDAGKVLRDTLGPDNAYVLIVDADECRKRLNWNTPEGPETDIRLKISWSKKGWALMNSEWDERREDIVQARTGALNYEAFIGLCITEISDSAITFRRGEDKRILEPGKSLFYSYNDSYEDHEGVEHRDIDYSLIITWLE